MYDLDTTRAVAVLSGGLDSTAALYSAMKDSTVVAAISFDYGQKHKKELQYAAATCESLSIKHHIIDLSQLSAHLGGVSSLVEGGEEVPEGHYAEANMASTVVPNRNMMMISIAASLMPQYGAADLILGMHGGDHFVYPDCRPTFVHQIHRTLIASFDNERVGLIVPFLYYDKVEAVRRGVASGMKIENTWSCYKGGDIHCGRCGTCVERLWAIHEAGADDIDRTEYADTEYWRTVTESDNNSNEEN